MKNKLTQAQQKIYDLLKKHLTNSYIIKSNLYRGNRIIVIDSYDKHNEVYSFTAPTFEVLLKKGIIKQLSAANNKVFVLT